MRTVAASLILVALPALAGAQTVIRTLDLTNLGWGQIKVDPVELDGNLATREYLVAKLNTVQPVYRVVVERQGQYCPGEWFTPTVPDRRADSWLTFERINVGGIAQLLATERWGWFGAESLKVTEIRFDIPHCH